MRPESSFKAIKYHISFAHINMLMALLLFHPEHNVLLVADGDNKRVLIVNPATGGLIQTIDLPDMGDIWALGLYKDQIVMLHGDADISYFRLSG